LSTDAIAGIGTEDIYALTVDQANSFVQPQIDAMTYDQVAALADILTS
jgi:hypothetical protein